jgi:hypothetical protein
MQLHPRHFLKHYLPRLPCLVDHASILAAGLSYCFSLLASEWLMVSSDSGRISNSSYVSGQQTVISMATLPDGGTHTLAARRRRIYPLDWTEANRRGRVLRHAAAARIPSRIVVRSSSDRRASHVALNLTLVRMSSAIATEQSAEPRTFLARDEQARYG